MSKKLIVLLASIPAGLAPGYAAMAVTEPSAAAGEEEKVVCRRYAPQTGSRIGARNICKTTAEWRIYDNEMEEAIRSHQTPFGDDCLISQSSCTGSLNQSRIGNGGSP